MIYIFDLAYYEDGNAIVCNMLRCGIKFLLATVNPYLF